MENTKRLTFEVLNSPRRFELFHLIEKGRPVSSRGHFVRQGCNIYDIKSKITLNNDVLTEYLQENHP